MLECSSSKFRVRNLLKQNNIDTLGSYTKQSWKFDLQGLGTRCAEMTVFLALAYPPNDDSPEVEFVDVNPSLGNALGFKLCDANINENREVWKDICPTLVGSSQIVVRFPHQRYVRRMEAVEYFGLIGWSPALWRNDTRYSEHEAMPPCSLCANLAGNAFMNQMLRVSALETMKGMCVNVC